MRLLNSSLYEFGIDLGKGGIYFEFSPNEEEIDSTIEDESSLQFAMGLTMTYWT